MNTYVTNNLLHSTSVLVKDFTISYDIISGKYVLTYIKLHSN